jgi:hypothetical protein
MTEFSSEERAMFRRARRDFEPTGAQRERNARALAARLGIGAGALVGSLSAASASAAAGAATSVGGRVGVSLIVVAGKWLTVGLLLGASVVSGVVAVQGGSAPAKSAVPQASAQRPLAVSRAARAGGASGTAPPATTAFALPAPVLQTQAARLPEPAPSTLQPEAPEPAAALGNVSEEARLLRRADNALHSGSFSYALQLLDELAVRLPNGVLAEERSAERISALCKLGRTAQAREEAARFLRSTPSSPLAKSVKASCAAPLDAPAR